MTISPSIHFLNAILTGIAEGWRLSHKRLGERLPVHQRTNTEDIYAYIHIHPAANAEPSMHVFDLWEEAGVA